MDSLDDGFGEQACVARLGTQAVLERGHRVGRPSTGVNLGLDYHAWASCEGLYDGPIDGWFAVYHRSILPLLTSLPMAPYFALAAAVRARLAQRGLHGLLDRGMRVFHVIGPAYAEAFGMLDFEIEKYRRLGRGDIVAWYEGHHRASRSPAALGGRIDEIRSSLERHSIVSAARIVSSPG